MSLLLPLILAPGRLIESISGLVCQGREEKSERVREREREREKCVRVKAAGKEAKVPAVSCKSNGPRDRLQPVPPYVT